MYISFVLLSLSSIIKLDVNQQIITYIYKKKKCICWTYWAVGHRTHFTYIYTQINVYMNNCGQFCRIYYIKGCMLWAGPIQWFGTLHNSIKLVPQQGRICFLGCIPSVREGKQNHSEANFGGRYQVHAPNESQHYYGLGL